MERRRSHDGDGAEGDQRQKDLHFIGDDLKRKKDKQKKKSGIVLG